MHQLHLLRHAKAEPAEELDDHERPLSRRGRDAARHIGKTLPKVLGGIDLVLCSTALRTQETAALALAAYEPAPRILFERALYLASRAALMRRLRSLEEDYGAVLLIGHNPGLFDLAVALAHTGSADYRTLAEGKFPTAARASFAIDTTWAALHSARHRLTDYVTVKSFGRGEA
jgi:phosphohistidine phosphatase